MALIKKSLKLSKLSKLSKSSQRKNAVKRHTKRRTSVMKKIQKGGGRVEYVAPTQLDYTAFGTDNETLIANLNSCPNLFVQEDGDTTKIKPFFFIDHMVWGAVVKEKKIAVMNFASVDNLQKGPKLKTKDQLNDIQKYGQLITEFLLDKFSEIEKLTVADEDDKKKKYKNIAKELLIKDKVYKLGKNCYKDLFNFLAKDTQPNGGFKSPQNLESRKDLIEWYKAYFEVAISKLEGADYIFIVEAPVDVNNNITIHISEKFEEMGYVIEKIQNGKEITKIDAEATWVLHKGGEKNIKSLTNEVLGFNCSVEIDGLNVSIIHAPSKMGGYDAGINAEAALEAYKKFLSSNEVENTDVVLGDFNVTTDTDKFGKKLSEKDFNIDGFELQGKKIYDEITIVKGRIATNILENAQLDKGDLEKKPYSDGMGIYVKNETLAIDAAESKNEKVVDDTAQAKNNRDDDISSIVDSKQEKKDVGEVTRYEVTTTGPVTPP